MKQIRGRTRTVVSLGAALALCVFGGLRPARAQTLTYIALGDSVAYGTQSTSLNGYVGLYAEWLSGVDGATVQYTDLAVPGETSSSILGAQLTNFNNTVASQKAAGDTITTISVSIGGNDFLNYIETLPTLTQFDQELPTLLQTMQTNYATLLTQVRAEVPNCDLILNSYYDITAFGTTIEEESDMGNLAFKPILQSLATQFDGRYVDNYTPFLGNNAEFISSDGIHPNDAGYAQIALDMEFAVPGPNALLTAAIGVLPGASCLLRRRLLRRA